MDRRQDLGKNSGGEEAKLNIEGARLERLEQ